MPDERPPALRPNLEDAFAYAGRGWPVFPLHTPMGGGCACGDPGCEHTGEHPRTRHRFHDRGTHERTIRQCSTRWTASGRLRFVRIGRERAVPARQGQDNVRSVLATGVSR